MLTLLGSFIVSFSFVYSLHVISTENGVLLVYFFPFVKVIKTSLAEYFDFISFELTVVIVFLGYAYFLHIDKISKHISMLISAFARVSLAIPISQIALLVVYSHYRIDLSVTSEADLLDKYRSSLILASSVLSAVLVSFLPYVVNLFMTYRSNSKFATQSGLFLHYPSIKKMKNDIAFEDAIKALGELTVVKILGVTGKNTFVTNDSFLHNVFTEKHLKIAAIREIKMLFSKENSLGLKERSRILQMNIEDLNCELQETKSFISKHYACSEFAVKYYEHEPKFKIIILEGDVKLAMLQAYANNCDILEEQIYVFKDAKNTSMYKMLNKLYDEIHSQIPNLT